MQPGARHRARQRAQLDAVPERPWAGKELPLPEGRDRHWDVAGPRTGLGPGTGAAYDAGSSGPAIAS
jgi:hypothetical protein